MDKNSKTYFLAANSAEGFVSHFGDCYDEYDGWRVYIIKGGPGSGKSSLMKKIASRARIKGLDVIVCPCSSDPDSLDAVVMEDIKTVILDGTAPHTLEPKLAGVCENIINLCDNWDAEILYNNREKIIEATQKNKLFHKAASRYLMAAGHIFKENLQLSLAAVNLRAANSFAAQLCDKIIPQKNNSEGKEWVRFFSGITPKGIIDFTNDNVLSYSSKIIISDNYGAVSAVILKAVRNYALAKGHTVITVKNPILPSMLIDALLLPEFDLCFLTENSTRKLDSAVRRIHARRFMDVAKINSVKEKHRFHKKIFNELIAGAAKSLANAKSVHDEIESYYISAMNFEKNAELTEKLWRQISKTL